MSLILFFLFSSLVNVASAEPTAEEKAALAADASIHLIAISNLVKGSVYAEGNLCYQAGLAAEAMIILQGASQDTKALETLCASPITPQSAASISTLAQKFEEQLEQSATQIQVAETQPPEPPAVLEVPKFLDKPSPAKFRPRPPKPSAGLPLLKADNKPIINFPVSPGHIEKHIPAHGHIQEHIQAPKDDNTQAQVQIRHIKPAPVIVAKVLAPPPKPQPKSQLKPQPKLEAQKVQPQLPPHQYESPFNN